MTTTPPNHIHFLLVARKEQMNDFPVKQRRNDEVENGLIKQDNGILQKSNFGEKTRTNCCGLGKIRSEL
jgi:hypothetical protein